MLISSLFIYPHQVMPHAALLNMTLAQAQLRSSAITVIIMTLTTALSSGILIYLYLVNF